MENTRDNSIFLETKYEKKTSRGGRKKMVLKKLRKREGKGEDGVRARGRGTGRSRRERKRRRRKNKTTIIAVSPSS